MLYINLYLAVLPLFKSFVLIFEQKEPMVHRFHDELMELFVHFLSCSMQQELVRDLSSSKLKKIDVHDEASHLPVGAVFMDSSVVSLLKDIDKKTRLEFCLKVKGAYIEAAAYMQGKFPLNNMLPRCLSSIDPKGQGHSVTILALKTLREFFPTVLEEVEYDTYHHEVSHIQIDKELPDAEVDGKAVRLDHWWAAVFKTGRYPTLAKVIKACLGIFTGPQIEQSFSVMNNLISSKSNRLGIDT